LTELDLSNASMYEGASAMAEGILMAERMRGRRRVILSEAIHPDYLQVARTYLANTEIQVVTFEHGRDGRSDLEQARLSLAEGASALVVQHPNFFGCLEEVESFAEAARQAGSVLIVVVTEAVSLGLLKGPGAQGADIVAGEAQSFGVPLSYGGPYLGFLAARKPFVRSMPGRLVGETRDGDGRRGYVLTLSTREQHIRREKATSNICTNEGLCALSASIFLALMGRQGLRELALQNHAKAAYARERIGSARGCRILYEAPVFNEFIVRLPVRAEEAVRALAEKGIVPGVPLSRYLKGRENDLLVCVTEVNPRAEIDRLAEELGGLG
jgi:glycine dehydrogenase subunit 1